VALQVALDASKSLRLLYEKGYFHIYNHTFLIWLQSFNKLLIRPPVKKVFQNSLKLFLKNQIRRVKQQTIFKKINNKRRGKNQVLYAFTHTRLCSMVSKF